MKETICTVIGIITSFIISLCGGWSSEMTTLLIFMVVDYGTGLIVSGIFKKSRKSKNGGLDSKVGWKGLCKKCMIFLFVIIGARLDVELHMQIIKNAVITAFMVNELISIVENAGIMGLPIPTIITKTIDVLQKTNKEDGGRL